MKQPIGVCLVTLFCILSFLFFFFTLSIYPVVFLLTIFSLVFNPLWSGGVTRSSFFVSRSFPGLGFARVVLSFFNLAPALFVGQLTLLPCRPIALPCCHLTCACWASFGSVVHFSFISSCCPRLLLGLFSYYFRLPYPILSLQGFLGPLNFFGHPWPISLLHSHRLLLNLSGFPGPITITFTNSFPWAPSAHFCLLSIFYDTHGLLTPSSGRTWSPFAFFLVFLLFYRPMDHYSYHSSLMVFSCLVVLFPFHIVRLLLFIGSFYQNGHQHSAP